MTAPFHPHRAPSRTAVQHAIHPLDHAPEVLLALAALIVVLAGPVTSAFAPQHLAVDAVAAVALVGGVLLAVLAAARLLRQRG